MQSLKLVSDTLSPIGTLNIQGKVTGTDALTLLPAGYFQKGKFVLTHYTIDTKKSGIGEAQPE